MKILISNDDGYKAPGIHVLARVMSRFGEVTVVSPKMQQSATAMAVSLGGAQLVAKELPEEGPGRWTYLDATPASCVKFGLQYKYENRDPDLVMGGINHGSNASTGANYSATLGVAEEGAINGIKAIGVSIATHDLDVDLSAVEALLPGIVHFLLEHWPRRSGIFYNVNFPVLPLAEIKGVQFVRQGRGHWVREFEDWDPQRTGAEGKPLEEGEWAFFMKGDFVSDDVCPADADHLLLDQGWVTIVPCQCDPTDYTELERLKKL